jgi:hypothetical protein
LEKGLSCLLNNRSQIHLNKKTDAFATEAAFLYSPLEMGVIVPAEQPLENPS